MSESIWAGDSAIFVKLMPLIPMQQISIHPQNTIQRCLLAVAAVVILPALCVAQDGWLYAWRNQPSGEFAPDYRKVDPFQPMFSDADLESQAARKAPSFLTQFASNVKTSALRDADTASIPDNPEFDAPEFDAPEFDAPELDALAVSDEADYEQDPAKPAAHDTRSSACAG